MASQTYHIPMPTCYYTWLCIIQSLNAIQSRSNPKGTVRAYMCEVFISSQWPPMCGACNTRLVARLVFLPSMRGYCNALQLPSGRQSAMPLWVNEQEQLNALYSAGVSHAQYNWRQLPPFAEAAMRLAYVYHLYIGSHKMKNVRNIIFIPWIAYHVVNTGFCRLLTWNGQLSSRRHLIFRVYTLRKSWPEYSTDISRSVVWRLYTSIFMEPETKRAMTQT